MMKKFFIICFLLFGCQKETLPDNDPNAIFNTQGWIVSLYSNNNTHSNIFDKYVFEFNDNPADGCAEWMDGKCPRGVFGGYYEILVTDGILKFNIILPPTFNLNEITGTWEIIIINSNTIHLRRLNGGSNQKIIFTK